MMTALTPRQFRWRLSVSYGFKVQKLLFKVFHQDYEQLHRQVTLKLFKINFNDTLDFYYFVVR